MKKNYFNVCENCGSHLDPGETCDCVRKETYTCIYCGAEVGQYDVCGCPQREKEMERCICVADSLRPECNLSLSFCDIIKIRDTANREPFETVCLAYKMGLVVASEIYRH